MITGRTVYHFHTRTKTGRVPELQAAASEVWGECSAGDTARLGLRDGDLAEVATPRGTLRARVRVGGIRDGVLFVPFHYGYWDTPGGAGPAPDTAGRAANELTATDWDPVSKQPLFKTAAARIARIAERDAPAVPTFTASRSETATTGGPR